MSSPLTSRLADAQQALTIAWDTKSHADIDIAITKWASILRYIDEDEEKCDDILSSYASALLLRWKKRSRAEDIDNAIETLEKSVHIQGDGPTFARYENYCNLGAAYLDRWEALEREDSDLLTAAERWELAHSIATQIGQTRESVS
jgi:tetratricopeptide (TPR) repeat protein